MLRSERAELASQSERVQTISEIREALKNDDTELVERLSEQLNGLLHPDSQEEEEDSSSSEPGMETPTKEERASFKLAPIAQRGMAGTSSKPKRPHGKSKPRGSGAVRFVPPERDSKGRTKRKDR